MLRIPDSIFTQYFAHLKSRNIAPSFNGEYRKWLRYYLDFCDKYPVPVGRADRVRLFCDKLKEKRQKEAQRERAAHAVSLYFEMLDTRSTCHSEESPAVDKSISSHCNLALPDQQTQQTADSRTEMGASPKNDGLQGNASPARRQGACPGRPPIMSPRMPRHIQPMHLDVPNSPMPVTRKDLLLRNGTGSLKPWSPKSRCGTIPGKP